MKLISTTDFVLEQDKAPFFHYDSLWEKIINYANFLKQPLEPCMFVPCDEDGIFLEEPYNYAEFLKGHNLNTLCEEYQQAKETCIFKGFELILQNESYYNLYRKIDGCSILLEKLGNKIIESLIQYEIELTPTAIKQIGL